MRFQRYLVFPCFALLLIGPLAFGQSNDGKTIGEVHQDFRGSRRPVPPLSLHGLDLNEVTRAEDGGLRITLPTNRQVGVAPSFRLTGDFEVTGTYDLLATEQPSRGYGVAVALELATDWVAANNKKYARVARLLRPKEGGSIYLANYWITDPTKVQGADPQPTMTRTGQLRLVRQGSMLRFLAADGSGNDFRELDRTEFGADDLVVHFIVNNNGSPTAVDALLVDFQIRAAALPAASSPTAQSGTGADGGNLAIGWLAAVAILVLAGGAWLYTRRRRRRGGAAARAPSGENETTPAAASASAFSCSSCGARLKAKADLAGKAIRCPKCGNIVLVSSPDLARGENDASCEAM